MKHFGFWNCLLQPIVGLSWAGAGWTDRLLPRHTAAEPARQIEEKLRSGLVKTDAEDLLDWLEAHGCAKYEITSTNGETFAVHWWN